MARYAYVDGRYVPHRAAVVHIEDRGFQFADAVYEVVVVVQGRLVDAEGHLDRLERSLGELSIPMPVARPVLELLVRELLRRNAVENGSIYLQVTRGIAPRDHKFPRDPSPTLVMTAQRVAAAPAARHRDGVSVITIPDIRWQRCDIKTTALIANCMGKTTAAKAGAYEAWQVDNDGLVTEGTSSNAWIVTHDDRLLTPPATNAILRGVTRQTMLRLASEHGVAFEERAFTVAEATAAREAFATSATSFVTPVVSIDGARIGDGTPGVLSRRLQEWYATYCASDDGGGHPR